MVTTAASRATNITTFLRRKEVVFFRTNCLSIPHLFSFLDFRWLSSHTSRKLQQKNPAFGGRIKEITLDNPTTHFGGQGLFLCVLGFNHWVTSLSAVSARFLRRNLNCFPFGIRFLFFQKIYVIGNNQEVCRFRGFCFPLCT